MIPPDEREVFYRDWVVVLYGVNDEIVGQTRWLPNSKFHFPIAQKAWLSRWAVLRGDKELAFGIFDLIGMNPGDTFEMTLEIKVKPEDIFHDL